MIKKLFDLVKSFFKKQKSVNESAWIARNVWNDPNLAKEDSLYKNKEDNS